MNQGSNGVPEITDPMFKQWIHKVACGAIKDAIRAHGPITPQLTNSVAKRVAGRIYGELKAKGITDE